MSDNGKLSLEQTTKIKTAVDVLIDIAATARDLSPTDSAPVDAIGVRDAVAEFLGKWGAKAKAKKKNPSRADRWADAVADALSALDDLEPAIQDLIDLQGEYQEWKDNLPD